MPGIGIGPETGTERNQTLDSALKVLSCSQSAFTEYLLHTAKMPGTLQRSRSGRSLLCSV